MKYVLFVFTICTLVSCGEKNTTEPMPGLQETELVQQDTTPRVTGIGGIFILSDNPDSMMAWYGDNLGLKIDAYGSPFEFRNANNPEEQNYLRWSAIGANTDFFNPSKKEFMINYRVYNIEALVEKLRSNGSVMLDSIASYDYGKFVHLMDPEGNKIELWEPIDSVLTKMGGPTTK
jgi:predicted enzyme related to lactoylglutathione lyase